jgi:two-component system, OmpR family, alkaline phosphatase synthesis response regulator PhoP
MGTLKVLVVDDEIQYLDVVAFKFRNAGLDVLTARDGQQALQMAFSQLPAVIVSDYQMPVLDGLELCRQLRADPRTAGVPFILLTAYGLDIQEDGLAEAGVTAVMSKPFSPRELLARVNELLRPARAAAMAEGT